MRMIRIGNRNLQDLRYKDGLKRLWPGKVVMGKHTVIVSTKLGKKFEAIHSEWLRLMNLDIANSGMSDIEVAEQMEALCDTSTEAVMNQTKIYTDIFQAKIDEINVKKRMNVLGLC